MFCKEFNINHIFRYKNQAAIETDPITIDNEVIGWQAKFYGTSLSDNKDEIIESLEKAKKKYPLITQYHFYSNQEFGQYKGTEPKSKQEIEEKAKEFEIKIEWKLLSFFESEFVTIKNELISKHFFSADNSIFDLIEHFKHHTENILRDINASMRYRDKEIIISREGYLKDLEMTKNNSVVISGVGGAGKTAIIKKLYENKQTSNYFYVFKASEFNINCIDEKFKNLTFLDFLNFHKEINDKIIVLDSSEKLLDLKNEEPIKEFISTLMKYNWKIIFTTRNNYLETLNYRFAEIYKISPLRISIENLNEEELENIALENDFNLPKDKKLKELIKNPFYLSQYLKYYLRNTNTRTYKEFKENLWINDISKALPSREQCFLKLSFDRANKGTFFVDINGYDEFKDSLVKDGILGYETSGYFITHDIYEEWALEKIVEMNFSKRVSISNFFSEIGNSLPMRRALKNWISEQLLLENEFIKEFIEDIFENKGIESFWLDEILVSVLLSEYSGKFFEYFKEDLLKEEAKWLKKISFLLRLACKEIDYDFLKGLPLKKEDISELYTPTIPKGKGWEEYIKFLFDNRTIIGTNNIKTFIPLLNEWSEKIRKGNITKYCGLIGLEYYMHSINNKKYLSRDGNSEIYNIILNCSLEIKKELTGLLDNIRTEYDEQSQTIHDNFISYILENKNFKASPIFWTLPKEILKLIDSFWIHKIPKSNGRFSNFSYDDPLQEKNREFGIVSSFKFDYFPASAYQTPFYILFNANWNSSVDFFIEFTNKCIESLVKNQGEKYFYKSVLKIDDEEIIQYSNAKLWGLYRGFDVAPDLLKSIHMAFEKQLLERAENTKQEILENFLIYLLKKSKSASITSIVTSVILAYPDKTFNVASILFKIKEFFLLDKTREYNERNLESLYGMGHGLNYNHKLFQDERLATCKNDFRKNSLEDQFFKYQLIKNEGVSEQEFKRRQDELWKILDNYYKDNEKIKDKTDDDLTWEIFLSRMDRRKMKIKTKQSENNVEFHFHPELKKEVEEYSKNSKEKYDEKHKHLSLNLWANFKFKKDEKYKNYNSFSENLSLALNSVREIITEFEKGDYDYYLLNRGIPGIVCSVLLRDYFEKLSQDEQKYCKEIIFDLCTSIINNNYNFQYGDGLEECLITLPLLLKYYPEEAKEIKFLLLYTLLDEKSIGNGSYLYDFTILGIHTHIYGDFSGEVYSILFNYFKFKNYYNQIKENIYKELGYEKNHRNEILNKFLEKFGNELESDLDNENSFDKINIALLNLDDLIIPFKLININYITEELFELIKQLIKAFLTEYKQDDMRRDINYYTQNSFSRKYSQILLEISEDKFESIIQPLLDNFTLERFYSDIIKNIIYEEDKIKTTIRFWGIWDKLKLILFDELKENKPRRYSDEIIDSYLFASILWKENASKWHPFTNERKRFFKEICKKLGHCPSVLFFISKFLTGVGFVYLENGIDWIDIILTQNDYSNIKLEDNTVFYLEKYIRKYLYYNHELIKKDLYKKNKVIYILNFLIENNSSTSYMLRDSIL